MRYQRTAALLAVALLYFWLGPLVVAAALGSLAHRGVRTWLRPTWRVVAAWVGAVAVLAGLVVVIPDGWLPIPPGPGVLVTDGYVGRAARAQPIDLVVPQHPHLAPNGRSSTHHDAWATHAVPGPGPLGDSVEVDTAWYGVEECASVAFDSHDRLVALCGGLDGPMLRVLDPRSMRPLASKDLPDRGDAGAGPWEELCDRSPFYLDARDRAVLATADRRILVVRTDDADGDPDLTTDAVHDLTGVVPEDDCLVALMPDWDGRIWWVTRKGLVGTVGAGGRLTSRDLGEEIANSLASDRDGSVYVVTVEALYALAADGRGRPQVRWRTAYDRGSERKPGQLSRGSGTTPTILPSGLVAIADNADDRMNVVFLSTVDGQEVCRAPVFGQGESATDSSLVTVGPRSVVVENNHGYTGPLRTMLGRTTPPGLARVDAPGDGGRCDVAWTAEERAPSSVATVSLETGLVYAVTKPRSWWGANAWYLTALDARTGRRVFSVRLGLGALMDNHRSAVTLGPDGSAYVATLAGMVRVRDKHVD